MAEGQGIWNRKLLIVALLLGVGAVALFYIHDALRVKEYTGDVFEVLKWRRDLEVGEKASLADVDRVTITKQAMDAVEGVIRAKEESLVDDRPVNRQVRRGQFVRYSDMLTEDRKAASNQIGEGMRGFPLPVDARNTPGTLVTQGDYVDVIGIISAGGTPAQTYTILERVRVLGVGGRSLPPEGPSRGFDPGNPVYHTVSIEVPKKVAEDLVALLPRIQGKLYLAVRNSRDTQTEFKGVLNPKLRPLLNLPLPPAYGLPERE